MTRLPDPPGFVSTLEMLRAVAAWMVVLHHLRPTLGGLWSPLGSTVVLASGVDLFFVLSGVVMVIVARGGIGPVRFLAHRAARILPLYWLVTAALVAALMLGLHPVGIAGWSRADVLASVLLWPAIRVDGQAGPLLAVGWTLLFEAVFYLIVAAGLVVRRRVSVAAFAIFALICAVAMGWLIALDYLPLRTWTAPILLEFLFGIGLGVWWCRRPVGGASRYLAGACFALGICALALGASWIGTVAEGALIPPFGAASAQRVLAFGLPMAAVVLAALLAERAGLRAGTVWRNLGAGSYAVYLLHLPVIQILGKVTGDGPLLLIALPLIALVAHQVHHRVERPLTVAARRYLSGQTRPKSSSSRMMSSSSR